MSNADKELNDRLGSVAQRGNSLLQVSEHIAASLPRSPYANDTQFPYLLAQYELLSNHSKDLHGSISDIFQHYTITPTETGHTEKGEPTLLLPDMLRSKRPPEQEMEELELKRAIKETPGSEEENFTAVTHRIEQYNNALLRCHAEASSLEREIIVKTKAMVEKYSASRLAVTHEDGAALFKYLEKGELTEKLKEVAP